MQFFSRKAPPVNSNVSNNNSNQNTNMSNQKTNMSSKNSEITHLSNTSSETKAMEANNKPMKKMKPSGLRGTYKTFLKNANNSNKNDIILVQNRPHKNLKGDLGVILTHNGTSINSELELQRYFAKEGISPDVNSNYAAFYNTSKNKPSPNTRKAYYIEKLTPINKFFDERVATIKEDADIEIITDQIIGVLGSFMEKVDILVDKLGYYNLDTKSDNIVAYDTTPEIQDEHKKSLWCKTY